MPQNRNKTFADGISSTAKPVEDKEYYPLSSAQKRLFLLEQFENTGIGYNMPQTHSIKEKFIPDNVKHIFMQLITRHQGLRTSFHWVDETPVQRIHEAPAIDFTIEHFDGTSIAGSNINIITEFIRPFDLSRPPLLRVGVIEYSNQFILLTDMHHIVSDGISMGLLTSELSSLLSGKPLRELNLQYRDYTVWQNNLLAQGRIDKQIDYWMSIFPDPTDIPRLNLPTDAPRPPAVSYKGSNYGTILSARESAAFSNITLPGTRAVTLFMQILAVFNVLLSRYTGQEDIIVGTTVAGRPHMHLENIIGMFVNSLPLRNNVSPEMSFVDLLEQVQHTSFQALENQDVPFEFLVEKINPVREPSRHPIFDVNLLVQSFQSNEAVVTHTNEDPEANIFPISKYDITLTAGRTSDSIYFAFEYCTDLFKRSTIERMSGHLRKIIQQVSKNPKSLLCNLDLMDKDEKMDVLFRFNRTDTEYPTGKTLHDLFREQAEQTPDAVAIVSGNSCLTYRELDRQSDDLAAHLPELGIQPGEPAALMLDRSFQMIIAIFGVLKAGAAYVPLAADYPRERIDYILGDIQARVTIDHQTFTPVQPCPPGFTPLAADPGSIAYIIYTSGTTGRPKGVMIEHQSAINTVSWFSRTYKTGPGEQVLQMSDYTFDASINQIFGTLLFGGTLHIVPKHLVKDAVWLRQYISRHLVNIIYYVPRYLDELLGYDTRLPSIRRVIAGGEALSDEVKDRIISKGYTLYNQYGPTESSVDAVQCQCGSTRVTLGTPISNTYIYIYNTYSTNPGLQPIGVPGELCIAGDGTARGYLNNPELTHQKFFAIERPAPGSQHSVDSAYWRLKPFTLLQEQETTPADDSDMFFFDDEPAPGPGYIGLYKSGDLARWLPDGNIEFLGRMDQQVKIRGFRIELEEIEFYLKSHESVKTAAVTTFESGGDGYICAYAVANAPGELPDEPAFKKYLSQHLPAYMIPSRIIELEALPLTHSGKLNANALPQPGSFYESSRYVPPGDELEKTIAGFWAEVLGIDETQTPVGVEDDFFESGGHSLKATVLALKIHRELDVKIPLEEIFKAPRIRDMARYVRDAAPDTYTAIPKAPEMEYYPLSPAQQRLFILQHMDKEQVAYNLPMVMQLEGNLDRAKLQNAFNQIIQRHEALRTSFKIIDDQTVQHIHENVEFEIETVEPQNRDPHQLLRDFVRPFDLSRVPLLRVGLAQLSDDQNGARYILLSDMHHIISDAVSNTVFKRELNALYNIYNVYNVHNVHNDGSGSPLSPPALQYKDYSHWQNTMIENGEMAQQESYWLSVFPPSDPLPVLHLPFDFPRPKTRDFQGRRLSFDIPSHLTKSLKQLARRHNATLFIVLLASLDVLLTKLTGQEDIVIGSPIAGRRHAALQDCIGVFINTLAFRDFPLPHVPFSQFLDEVRDRSLKAYENQEFPFEDLVEKAVRQRDTSRNPLFDVVLTIQDMDSADTASGPQEDGLSITALPFEIQTAKFDLSFLGLDTGDTMQFSLEYAVSLFKEETAVRFARYFRNILSFIANEPSQTIGGIDIMTEEEKRLLILNLDNTNADFPHEQTVTSLFEETAEKYPGNIALIPVDIPEDTGPVTYGELNRDAELVAQWLTKKGVGPDSIVAISMTPSIDLLTGILGILKAGGAYLPIDPEYPGDRIDYIMNDSCAAQSLTGIKDIIEEESAASAGAPARCAPSPQHLAYIIYTSGSTGRPKGSAITHRNVTRLFFTDPLLFDFGSHDTWTLFHSSSFDFSVWEIYGALLFGGRLLIVPRALARDTRRFRSVLAEYRVTVLNQTPSAFYNLMNVEPYFTGDSLALRYIIFGGEALNPAKLKPWKEKYPEVKLINMYGITETTVHVTYKEITPDEIARESSNIGLPVPTLNMCILDKNQRLAPPGVAGEICVGGEGLSRGYLNCPELTAEKFVPHPFLPGQRLYRSGDLGRVINNNHDIEHLGRIDHQVKIRGFRIELGEIESRLLDSPLIEEAVVIARNDPDRGNELWGYVVPVQTEPGTPSLPLDIFSIKKNLARDLPDYMIPAHIIEIEKIPLTVHGKINTGELPLTGQVRSSLQSPFEAPHNQLERDLTVIWSEILGLDTGDVGIDDNFFDLGGNSLDIVKVSNKIKEVLDIDIPVPQLFEHPTIKSIARFIHPPEESEEQGKQLDVLEPAVEEIETSAPVANRDIAVIGMAGRFPGAPNTEKFWENLANGVESITFFTPGELKEAGVPQETIDDPLYVPSNGAQLEDRETFDAQFFNYTANQAELMSPQLRLLHECCWEALEDAGYSPGNTPGSIGLFAGVSSSFYWEVFSMLSGKSETLGQFASSLLSSKDHAITNVSYKLNLKGPAVLIQTACSTSLVAIDFAINAMREGRCHMALAGGSTVSTDTSPGYMYLEGMLKSADGHCRAFDASATGLTSGEGAGIVVLKPMDKAIEDRDFIHAVIKGCAINNDGSRKVGFTAPSIQGQSEAIRTAIQNAGVPAETITYIETHGTGTKMGDPIEIQGLVKAFNTKEKNFCKIGSVKTNIGHLDAAAGVAGVIKTILAMKHRQIPPSLHFEHPNPDIDFENSPFTVNTRLIPWDTPGFPRRAGVSSFGIGGTNAHIVLEEAPPIAVEEPAAQPMDVLSLIPISAQTPEALDRMVLNLSAYLDEYLPRSPHIDLADAAYTLQVGRSAFKHRRFAVCTGTGEAVEILKSPGTGKSHGTAPDEPPGIVFMFAGLGSQYTNMGLDLYRHVKDFREPMDRCFNILSSLMDIDIKSVLYPGESGEESSSQLSIDDPEIVQPAVFCIEYALASLLIARGIQPTAMTGYSFGEYAAAAVAGVFTLEDALALVVHRGRLIARTGEGAMISVPASLEQITPLLQNKTGIGLAVDNGDSCIVSGDRAEVEAFQQEAKTQKWVCLPLQTGRAIHSPMMDSILTELEIKISTFRLNPPSIPYISNVTGDWADPAEVVTPGYWSRHLRGTVKFHDGILKLVEKPGTVYIEIGPGRDLSTLVARYLKETGNYSNPQLQVINPIRHPSESIPDHRHFMNKIGELWVRGAIKDWEPFHIGTNRRRVPLPAYSFDKKRYWEPVDLYKSGKISFGGRQDSMFDGLQFKSERDMSQWLYTPVWNQAPLPLSPLDFSAHGDDSQPSPGSSPCWLIFLDSHRAGNSLANLLKALGHQILTVSHGETFSINRNPDGSSAYAMDCSKAEDFDRLFNDIKKQGTIPTEILYLPGLTAPVSPAPDDDKKSGALLQRFDRFLYDAFYPLLKMVQSLGRNDMTSPMRLTAVTNNLYEVIGNDALNPDQAVIVGAVKSIPLEYRNILSRVIDIEMPQAGSPLEEQCFHRVVHQLLQPNTQPQEINRVPEVFSFRGTMRWKPGYSHANLQEAPERSHRIREKGVYLISGGFGGMGLTIAKDLAKHYKARLILVSRSPLPDREQWPQWLDSHDADDATSVKIRAVMEMETHGARIMPVSADISNLEQMRGVIDESEKKWGQLNGVIHTAGIIDYGGVIQRREQKDTNIVLDPKARGLLVLESLIDSDKLDFFMIFSSIASVLVTFGQVGYISGNSFLDAYALSRNSMDGKYTVINWCDWLEVGMAIKAITKNNEGNPERAKEEIKMLENIAVSPSEGSEAFFRMLHTHIPRFVVSIQELEVGIRLHWGSLFNIETPDVPPQDTQTARHARPRLSTEYEAPSSDLEITAASVLEHFLGIDRVGIDDNFFELGLSSLDMIQVNSRLNKALDREIPLVTMFSYPTIRNFAQHIQQPSPQDHTDTELDQADTLLEQSLNLLTED